MTAAHVVTATLHRPGGWMLTAWLHRTLAVLAMLAAGHGTATAAAAAASETFRAVPKVLRVVAVGDIADCRRQPPGESMAARTASLVSSDALVLALGDMAYQYADAATLASCYEPTWGRLRAATLAIAGNHDYKGGDARDFREYFGLVDGIDPRFVAYTRWLDEHWFLVALDSNVAEPALEAQFEWLQRTLADELEAPGAPVASQRCMLVLWHAPYFSSGLHRGSGQHMRRYWDLLDRYGADLLLSGHEHFYEAFEPMGSDGSRRLDGEGLRQFVVGTGGARLYGFWKPPYASRARVQRYGVLELELQQATYRWQFVDIEGSVHDAGNAPCRRGV